MKSREWRYTDILLYMIYMLIFIWNIPGKICRQWVAMVAAEREMIGLGQRLTFYHISFQIIFFNLLNIF